MTCLHIYKAKLDCKDLKVSLIVEIRPNVSFYRQREEKPCHLRFAMKASGLSCQACITTFSNCVFIFTVCDFRDVASENLSILSPKQTLIFILT